MGQVRAILSRNSKKLGRRGAAADTGLVAKDQEIERLTGLLAERDTLLANLRTEVAVAGQRAEGRRGRGTQG
jgi:hypothetical protein